jgi:two-component system sensor histidine kinase QseC
VIRPRTLRGRLVAAMLLILVLALGVSSLLDRLDQGAPVPAEDEPYQDALVLAGFCLPALGLIWAVSSWSLRPLARISQEAGNVGPSNPASRLSPAGLPAEIVPLVSAVNGALDRMAAAFEAERRFTENAAHELRTPLAVLSLRLQRARQQGADGGPDWAAIDGDLAQLNRLVAQMLDLARKENAGRARETSARPVVNFSRIVREACAAILPMVEAHGRTLSVAIPDAMPLQGDANDLRDALRNLLENAVLHGSGHIALDATLCDEDRRIELSVTDEGQGFDAAKVTEIFGRFCKGGRSEGLGLGLAIVREVLRSHGGDAVALPGPPGCMRLYLPAKEGQGALPPGPPLKASL